MIKYCASTFKTERMKTREIKVGHIGVGGNNPVRIQSMTTSNTRDVDATLDQIIRLADNGCEIVRITVQGMKEADACEGIKNGLIKKGYNIPLVADIHFFPPAAMRVVDFVDKVRINPGNFVDKRASFKVIEYDDASYALEIAKIEEKFTPLVEKCKKLKRALRIGANHGSLSDRILNRFGDTPQGMIESAMEYARVCRQNDFHDFIFSMKSSNPQVMIAAYRLLQADMLKLDWDYPLHLGVTEAGEGEDGRIKSAMGIGSLLLDGLGDTIRISLTEDAWNEIDPCKRLITFAKNYENSGLEPFEESYRHIENIKRRPVTYPKTLALHRDGSVFQSVSSAHFGEPELYKKLGCDGQLGQPKLKVSSTDTIILTDHCTHHKLKELKEIGIGVLSENQTHEELSISTLQEALNAQTLQNTVDRFSLSPAPKKPVVVQIETELESSWSLIEKVKPALLILAPAANRLHYARKFFNYLQKNNLQIPVILRFKYEGSKEDLIIQSAAEFGSLFCDKLGEGIWIDAPFEIDFLRTLSFSILQSARMRTSKTDFISCPSCGRTLFDLQDVSKRIRLRTSHLPGVKIAIMGCIVNGPGEMADADFGYVGSKTDMIDLYVGKTCVEKDIPFSEGDDRLVELIKKHGRWIEPATEE